jgi:8-oxo-dGTP diphosphatase
MITVTAGILFKDSRVFIGKRKPAGRLPGKWEFPGGKVEEGETPEACLERELEEELEIEAMVGDLLWVSMHDYDFGTVKVLFFRVQWDGGEIHPKDHEEYGWVPVDQLKGYDFVPADRAFVRRLVNGDIGPHHG